MELIHLTMPDFVGMLGVSMILTAYYRLNTHKIKAVDMQYQLLNLIGSLLILFSLLFHWNTSSVIIEIAWIIISILGIQRAMQGASCNTE